jgi:malonate-semialdehyde dehydrogenase (acetylating)/methylmalonate-semialdehyde dehydrogenase
MSGGGSTPTAKKIAEACGRSGKRSMLLGGAKNYLVAMEDAQMDIFIENYLHSCYGSAGQRCLSGSVVAAVPEIYEQVVDNILEVSKTVKIGDALDPDVYMGPVISADAKKKIEGYIEVGIKEGANLVLDGRNPEVADKNKDGYFVGPTVFTEVDPKMTIATDEIFGPVVAIVRINNLDEAIQVIGNQEVGNGACIFTQNLYYTEKFISDANVGMVGVNVGVCAPDKVQGKDGVNFFTQNKIATVRYAPPTGRFTGEGDKALKMTPESKDVRSCVAT